MNLKIARIKKGLTQEGFALKSGVSRLTISNLERKKIQAINVKAGILLKLSEALDTTLQELFFNEEE